jgi:hypothetical protein
MAARQMGGLSLADALAFCLLLADVDPPRFDRAIARWHARFVLEAEGITAVLALCAAKGAASPRYARRRRPDRAANRRRARAQQRRGFIP